MFCRTVMCLLVALIGSVFLLGERSGAAVIEVGDLNIIDDPGNPSDGLRFLDLTFSQGKTLADALANAISSYANVRVATPSEFDDLFAAAGVIYNGSETASDAFTVGSDNGIGSNALDLQSQLGVTNSVVIGGPPGISFRFTRIWTEPDGDSNVNTTRDVLVITSRYDLFFGPLTGGGFDIEQTTRIPQTGVTYEGWLLVSDSTDVPEPSSALLMCLGTAGWLGCLRRRNRGMTMPK